MTRVSALIVIGLLVFNLVCLSVVMGYKAYWATREDHSPFWQQIQITQPTVTPSTTGEFKQ